MDRDAFLDSFGEIIADASDAIDEAILVFSNNNSNGERVLPKTPFFGAKLKENVKPSKNA